MSSGIAEGDDGSRSVDGVLSELQATKEFRLGRFSIRSGLFLLNSCNSCNS
jgi:hypothetical protein